MPRTPEQNQNIKDKRRAKLLAHALKAFATYGFDKTAIDDITKAAKCSHGLFYHYFDSKEAVFAALVDEILTQESEFPAKEALALGGTQGLRLIAEYAERISKGSPRDVAIAKITFFISDAQNLNETGKRFALEHDLFSTLVTLIKEAQQEGKAIAGNPRDIAQAFADLARGSVVRLFGSKNATPLSADVLYAMVLKGPIDA